MTVAELIAALSDFPPDMDVNYADVDYGYVGIAKVEIRDGPPSHYGEPPIPIVVVLP
jgi:hypothetical protein